jgi:hypothetical protein
MSGEQEREGQSDPRNRFGFRNILTPSAETDDHAVFEKKDRNGVTARHPLAMLLDLAA